MSFNYFFMLLKFKELRLKNPFSAEKKCHYEVELSDNP